MVGFGGELQGRLLHRCYNPDIGVVTGFWYLPVLRYRGVVRYQYFGAGNIKSGFVAEGATNKNQRVKHEKSVLHARVPPGQAPQATSPRACHRFHHLYASGRSLSFSSSRDIAPPERATPPTNRLLQRLRASCLPRALAAFDPGHGSRGGALAEVFGECATLAHPTSNEPTTTDSVEPIMAAMDLDAAPGDAAVAFAARLAGRSSVASSYS
jgi:hypothetical protein